MGMSLNEIFKTNVIGKEMEQLFIAVREE